ncbi:MAG: hypothetical protein ACOYB2_04355 [Limnohabitans sp.]
MNISNPTEVATVPTWNLLWRVRLSALYHLKRERFLDGVDKSAKLIGALGGAAAFSQIKTNSNIGQYLTALITVVSTVSLVYGPSAKARKHAELARDFKKLEAKITEKGKQVFESVLSEFESQYLSIESSEPAALGALVTQCHNELCEAYGLRNNITPLPIWQRALKNYFDFDQTMRNSSDSECP